MITVTCSRDDCDNNADGVRMEAKFGTVQAARAAGWKGMGWERPGERKRYWGLCPNCQRQRWVNTRAGTP